MNMNRLAQEIIDTASAAGLPAPEFLVEVMNVETGKCLGVVHQTSETVDRRRTIGYSGRIRRVLTADMVVERGAKVVILRASAEKPLTIWETLYPASTATGFVHPLDPKMPT